MSTEYDFFIVCYLPETARFFLRKDVSVSNGLISFI